MGYLCVVDNWGDWIVIIGSSDELLLNNKNRNLI